VEKEKLVEELSKLTVLELSELKTALEEKWGVKAAAAVAQVVAAAPTAAAEAVEESTDFEVTLAEVPALKAHQRYLKTLHLRAKLMRSLRK
jgi:large subunit ribosomal protein L7/L12